MENAMNRLISLILIAAFGVAGGGCVSYSYDRVQDVPAYGTYSYSTQGYNQSYYPVRQYDSHWDYYRHFNGIDG
jgi:hypothetical protein